MRQLGLTLACVVGVTPIAAAAAPGDPADQSKASTVAPLTVHPLPDPTAPPAATVKGPTDASGGGLWASIWPHDAYAERISGRVILTCDVDRYGLAESCQVAAETPPNRGFGQAALEMRPLLKLPPPGGGAADALENIAIDFNAPEATVDFAGPPVAKGNTMGASSTSGDIDMSSGNFSTIASRLPEKQAITMLDNPVWETAASFADVEAAYPAKGGGADGYAVDHCQVDRQGRLSGCQVTKEAPENRGFDRAALSLAAKFRVAPQSSAAPHRAELWVDIPIRFPAPRTAPDRSVTSPNWVSGFNPDEVLKIFPPEAAAKGITSGHGAARCVVRADGSLADCTPGPASPDGVGFSEATVRLASTMRMNPWRADGAPVDGAVVEVGVTFNLKAGS